MRGAGDSGVWLGLGFKEGVDGRGIVLLYWEDIGSGTLVVQRRLVVFAQPSPNMQAVVSVIVILVVVEEEAARVFVR